MTKEKNIVLIPTKKAGAELPLPMLPALHTNPKGCNSAASISSETSTLGRTNSTSSNSSGSVSMTSQSTIPSSTASSTRAMYLKNDLICMSEEEFDSGKWFRMRHMAYAGALLPGIGCYMCILYTFIFQYENIQNSVPDDCPNVHSFITPVSYIIGVWEPQRFIWMIIMFLHIPSRIGYIVLYKRLFVRYAPCRSSYHVMLWFFERFLIAEPMGLIWVSVVDIKSNFVIHALAYALWNISFNFNVLFNILLTNMSGLRNSNRVHLCAWRIKVFMFITGVTVSLSTALSYPMFMAYCSSIAYSAFSIAEYIIVGYNSAFYFIAYFEFPEVKLTVGLQKLHCVHEVRKKQKKSNYDVADLVI